MQYVFRFYHGLLYYVYYGEITSEYHQINYITKYAVLEEEEENWGVYRGNKEWLAVHYGEFEEERGCMNHPSECHAILTRHSIEPRTIMRVSE